MVDLRFSQQDEIFRREVADWMADNLVGEFACLRHRGGPGDDSALIDERKAWEQHLGNNGWTCVGWPTEHGGRGLSLMQQVIFHEEYARAGGPGRLGHMGEGLLGPTIMAFGSEQQKETFLPGIAAGKELWCQGYSEPNAGSDLANVQTRAELVDDQWTISGQKVWTSWAEWCDWGFVICRTEAGSQRHHGLSYLLVPMRQDGIEIRPIVQITGDAEFSEVFYDNAQTHRDNVVGEVGEGWKVAMGTLAFERGASTLGQQQHFVQELDAVIRSAEKNGRANDPVVRQRLADAWIGLSIMRFNTLRMLSGNEKGELGREALIYKLYWATWHRELGRLAMDVMGADAELTGEDGELTMLQKLFLFTRSDTIYAGTNQVQRNIIAERALGLPREVRPE